jgi:hypothetical protein
MLHWYFEAAYATPLTVEARAAYEQLKAAYPNRSRKRRANEAPET